MSNPKLNSLRLPVPVEWRIGRTSAYPAGHAIKTAFQYATYYLSRCCWLLANLNVVGQILRKEEAAMTYEINELLEVGDAGWTIQDCKCVFIDELSGTIGPNEGAR